MVKHDITTVWPGYVITGTGKIACVLHCSRRIVLVGYVLEGRQIVAAKCSDGCRVDENPRWHRGYVLDEQPQATPRKRFPGWKED